MHEVRIYWEGLKVFTMKLLFAGNSLQRVGSSGGNNFVSGPASGSYNPYAGRSQFFQGFPRNGELKLYYPGSHTFIKLHQFRREKIKKICGSIILVIGPRRGKLLEALLSDPLLAMEDFTSLPALPSPFSKIWKRKGWMVMRWGGEKL